MPNVGFRAFAGELCVVNREFSNLQCLMNILPWDEFDTVINSGQMSCCLDTNYY